MNPPRFNAQGQEVDERGQVIIKHAYLTDGGGAPLKFLRVLNEACPSCGRGANPNKLGILREARGQETVHCLSCDYQLTREPAPVFRPMNSGPGFRSQ